MEKYLDKDAETLERMLAACTDFKERRNIREALRELKGLKLDGNKIVTYSFGTDTLKRLSSLKSHSSSAVSVQNNDAPLSKVRSKNETNDNIKGDSKRNGLVTHVAAEEQSYNSKLHAGNLNTEPNTINLKSKIAENGLCVACEENSYAPNKGLNKTSDDKNLSESSICPNNLNLDSTSETDSVVGSKSQPRHVKRTYSSPFSPAFLLSSVSQSVARSKYEKQNYQKDLQKGTPNDLKNTFHYDEKKLRDPKGESVINMKTQDSRRNVSESSLPAPINELSWADEVKKERSKSCNTENDYDIDGVKIRKKPNLSRKNRVESEWSMSPRLGTKFRKKLGSSTDSNIASLGSSSDSVINAVNTSDIHACVNTDASVKNEPKLTRAESAKKPPARRKLPEVPAQSESDDDDSDENVHERTLRLLHERRQKRREKFQKENESDTSNIHVSNKKGTVEEKSRSKKKEIRLRRELQLLNRASESIIAKTESQLTKSDQADSDDEEEKHTTSSHPVRRSKSDMVRSKPPITPESAARKVEETKEKIVVAVDLEGFDAMPTENKIDLIGNLMQEEAKLQETLRRTTSFSERRKIRSEVRQLRKEQRKLCLADDSHEMSSIISSENYIEHALKISSASHDWRFKALEGSPEAQPVSILQRSVSLSSGEITATAKTKGALTSHQDKNPSLEELRKQLSETSDYDEKRKIRLALRQLRQQSRESDDNKQGTKVLRSQSCVETKSPHISSNSKEENDLLRNGIVVIGSSNASESKTSTSDKVIDKEVDSKLVTRSQGVIETKTQPPPSTATGSSEKGLETPRCPEVCESKSAQSKVHENKSQLHTDSKKEIHNTANTPKNVKGQKIHETESEESGGHSKVNGHDLLPQHSVKVVKDSKQGVITNGSGVTVDKVTVRQHSGVSTETKHLNKNKHSSQKHSKTSDPHSATHSKTQSTSKVSLVEKPFKDSIPCKPRQSNTPEKKNIVERKRFSVGDYEQSKSGNKSSEKYYSKQRKHSLESLADSYRARDQEDRNNRHIRATVLKDVIGKLEDKISKSKEEKNSKPISKILISRANSESSLIKRLKDSDSKSKEKSNKQLKESENLSRTKQKESKKSEINDSQQNEIVRYHVNGVESQILSDSISCSLDTSVKEKNNDKLKSERISPTIPWLEEKKKSSPTPNDLDKLMSTMDIENAFSQILDAVEHFPSGTDTSEPPTPDIPINPIVEEEQSCESSASGLESATEEVDENKNICEKESISNRGQASENCGNEEVKLKQNIASDATESEETKTADIDTDKSCTTAKTNSAINSNSGIMRKSEAQIQLKSSLSLDLPAAPQDNSAISVLHGDDGTVTVQEVSRVQEGDTTITEWKKVRRTQSRTEERETDTIKERMVTSPGGTSSMYEKDVSKTKRKITSRGSDYFSRNNYNLRRLKDLEGAEIVEHELTSVSENMSVTNNKSWGSKSEAKVVLNKDENSEQSCKVITAVGSPKAGDMTLTSGQSVTALTPQVHLTLSKTSSGYGSVSGSEGEERDDVIETPLGRPSGCPVISSNMKEVTAPEGSTAILECSVTSSPLPTITWYKGNNAIQKSEFITFHFDGAAGKASLKIREVTPADIGEYSCAFSNPLGSAETKANLNVKKKALGPPSFIKQLADVTVIEGCSIVLECEVAEVDSVSWYKDWIIQRNSADFKQTFDGEKARLEIGEIFLDDEGIYTCAIKNCNGECRSSCKVSVKESVSDHSVAPAFLKKLESQIVEEKDTVIMECDIIGSPQPVITWYCDKKAVPEGDRFSMSYDGRVARLIMKSATKGDNGRYECVAESSAGRVTCDCLLVVKDIKRPPSVAIPLSDITVDDGKSAILECCIMGNPVPQIVWRKNGLVIGQMFDFKQTYIDNLARLEISKVCVQDSGCYECVGTNDLGEDSTACNLTVQDKSVSKSTSSTQSEEVIPTKEDNTEIPPEKTKSKVVNNNPAGFTASEDNHQVKAAKSQASKVMLVRQSSLRLTDQGKTNRSMPVKRSGSFQVVRQSKRDDSVGKSNKEDSNTDNKKEDTSISKLKMKGGINMEPHSVIGTENHTQSKTELSVHIKADSEAETRANTSELLSDKVNIATRSVSEPSSDKNEKSELSETSKEAIKICSSVPKFQCEKDMKISVSSIHLTDISKKSENMSIDSDKENDGRTTMETEKDESSRTLSESNKVTNSFELDHNENIKLDSSSKNLPHLQTEKDSVRVKSDEDKCSVHASDSKASPKLVIAMSAKDPDQPGVSVLKTAKDAAISKFEKLCSDAEEKETKPRFKLGSDIRRTQSVRTAGNEKPEWLQMKLKRVGEPKSPAVEKRVIASSEKDTTVSNEKDKPTSVPKDIKLTRSNSARVSDKQVTPPLNDSTNTHIPDRNNDKPKITPVSERAKIFQMNQESSLVMERKSPSAIIAKAINLSRAESMRAPVGHKSINVHNVQRSHSFKTAEQSASEKGVTLDLMPPKAEGKETGESGVAKKPIKYWDPTAAPTTTMDYSTINDEEELHKLLTSCENFEERKKLRARIKEVRDIRDKKWEEERKQRASQSEDILKKRQREADLEKQRKLEAYKVQAAQPHEQKHLEVREQRLKEKMREAEEQKQKALEAYDRMARKEDTSAASTVHTETKGGKTVTVRKVESVSKTGGIGGTSYGKPAEEEAETLVTKLINASSPTVSGILNVKTESWSSKDGITHKSEKTESWGGRKPQGAMNAFKQMDAQNNPQTNLGPPKGLARSPSAIKTMLLEWTKAMTREYTDKIQIENFSTSWNDGIAFCALIHHFYPEAFDFYSLDPKNRRSNFELAFDTAEKYADIAPLLDVEDMVKMKKPDWKCVFTYVQSFYRKLKDHENNRVKSD